MRYTAPAGGCVATFGSTRLTWGTNPDPFRTGTHFYCEKTLGGFWQGPGNGSFAETKEVSGVVYPEL